MGYTNSSLVDCVVKSPNPVSYTHLHIPECMVYYAFAPFPDTFQTDMLYKNLPIKI